MDAAWLLGVGQPLAVMDPMSGDVYSCGILRTESIDGYGALYHVYLDEIGDVVQVLMNGKYYLTHYSNVVLISNLSLSPMTYSNSGIYGVDE